MHKTNLFCLTFTLFILISLSLPLSVTAQQPIKKDVPSPLGKLVDVGGRHIHIHCIGEGSPTVVMEAGAGDFSFDWSLVQPKVAKFTRVCTYDRAGYAWSDAGPMPRTLKQIVYELHTGLDKTEIKPPFVLVGHSLGGLTMRVFAQQYPKEVAGMVLVDSSHEDQLIGITDRTTKQEKIVRWRELSSGKQVPPVQTTMATTASSVKLEEEVQLTAGKKVDSPFDKLPLNIQQIRLWATSQPKRDPARVSETFDFFAEELAEIYAERSKGKYSLGSTPLIVMTRGIANDDEQTNKQLLEDHDKMQLDLLTLSSNSKHIIARKSGHHIQLDEPKLVINAIKQVVKAARNSSKLS
jgi:pimeloyl-ACP methyl ester carboxylesterase